MLVDSQARKDALNLESKIIKAPAGSGKTGLLTNYYLKLLSVVSHPREIQAMTFTNKAAREMAERILLSLNRAKSGFKPNNDFEKENIELAHAALKNSAKRGWCIEENINMLQISTIDSFCKKLLMHTAGEHEGTLATRNVSNDPHLLYKKAITELLYLHTDSKYGPQIRNLIAHFGNKVNRVEKLLIEMLETRERWIPVLFMQKTQVREALESKRASFIVNTSQETFNTVKGNELRLRSVFRLLNNLGSNLSAFCENGFDCDLIQNIDTFKAISKVLLTATGAPKKRFTKNDGIPADLSKTEKDALTSELKAVTEMCGAEIAKLSALPRPEFKETEWTLLEATFNVMPLALAKLALTFKQAGEVDFTEVAMGAVRALNSESGVSTESAINKSQTIKHILVDEFQDSNDTQLVMLELLTESWSENDGNTLFIVGDPMQSLYGFRNANVNIFMKAQYGIGNVALNNLQLETNFRSFNGVVDWVNGVFETAFPQDNDLLNAACKYTKSEAIKLGTSEQNSVEVHGFLDDDDAKEEAAFIAEQVKNIHSKEPNATIAVLGRTRSVLKPVLAELENQNLHAKAVNVSKINKEPLCITAIALARILIDDLDKLAWLTVLNSGLVGLSLNDIEAIFKIDEDPYLAVNDDKVHDILTGATLTSYCNSMKEINAALDAKRNKDFELVLEGLWLKLNGPSLAETSTDTDNVSIFFDVFKGTQSCDLNLSWLDRQLDNLYAKPKPLANNSRPVELMTIHGSKGLEFDYVFIPGMHKRGPNTPSRLFSWGKVEDRDLGVMACSEAIGIKGVDITYHNYLNKLNAIKEQHELVRLMYVAVTRAVKQAFLTGKVSCKDDEISAPPKNSLFFTIGSTFYSEVNLHDAGMSKSSSTAIHPVRKVIDAQHSMHLPQRNTLAAYRGQQRTQLLPNGIEFESKLLNYEQAVIQQVIEQIGKDGIDNWNNKRVDEYAMAIMASLKQYSVPNCDLIRSVINVKNEIKELLTCDIFRSLNSNHELDHNEVAITIRKNRELKSIVIDKAFINKNGIAHVVDWESSKKPAGQEYETYINSQKAKHKLKLELYGKAYRELCGVNQASGYVYFTKRKHLELCG
ncbi:MULTISPECIES: exodeoxyribonuclease V subunit beta [Pseudoalteromonas]|uniref:UvrD-helicase domain-containing protein n=1 Tax=Pseudoalteromonas TaxID=53246 RepID=UPI001582C87E|nr:MULTISPECIES: UvrD-helicase domain-containing protein [Pseudoalteromonas]MDI4652644.1 UvrD-helicase domain-containing protein [Pseudoalteromonas shioyasakiensis]NUJ38646.1 UvrD-helicase domain-containing protein [Pseudoalteromonas sp. 0303]